jgi:hypothetical protein
MTDDLSLGLHVFTPGWLTAAETENVKHQNSVADMMISGLTAPSVSDAASILDASGNTRIPRIFAQSQDPELTVPVGHNMPSRLACCVAKNEQGVR